MKDESHEANAYGVSEQILRSLAVTKGGISAADRGRVGADGNPPDAFDHPVATRHPSKERNAGRLPSSPTAVTQA